MVAVRNLKGEIIQLILSQKGRGGGGGGGGVLFLVSATPTNLLNCLLNFYETLHNLQMCMKEYRCCLKFRRRDNSSYTFTKIINVLSYQMFSYVTLDSVIKKNNCKHNSK